MRPAGRSDPQFLYIKSRRSILFVTEYTLVVSTGKLLVYFGLESTVSTTDHKISRRDKKKSSSSPRNLEFSALPNQFSDPKILEEKEERVKETAAETVTLSTTAKEKGAVETQTGQTRSDDSSVPAKVAEVEEEEPQIANPSRRRRVAVTEDQIVDGEPNEKNEELDSIIVFSPRVGSVPHRHLYDGQTDDKYKTTEC
jgi:hypothetical protein